MTKAHHRLRPRDEDTQGDAVAARLRSRANDGLADERRRRIRAATQC